MERFSRSALVLPENSINILNGFNPFFLNIFNKFLNYFISYSNISIRSDDYVD